MTKMNTTIHSLLSRRLPLSVRYLNTRSVVVAPRNSQRPLTTTTATTKTSAPIRTLLDYRPLLSSSSIQHRPILPLSPISRPYVTAPIPLNPTSSAFKISYAQDGTTPLAKITLNNRTALFRLNVFMPLSSFLDAVEQEFFGKLTDAVELAIVLRQEYPVVEETIVSANKGQDGIEMGGSNSHLEHKKQIDVRWSKASALKDFLETSKHGQLFLVINGVQKIPIQLPTYEERTVDLRAKLASLQSALAPLEETKTRYDLMAKQAAGRVAWMGLFALCLQFGVMARLTWWDYSWDVTEPFSYFLTFGTSILAYIFYTITRREYSWETLGHLTVSRNQRKMYEKQKFELENYLNLKGQVEDIEKKLEDIRKEYA